MTTHLSGPVSVGELERLVASLRPVDAHDPHSAAANQLTRPEESMTNAASALIPGPTSTT